MKVTEEQTCIRLMEGQWNPDDVIREVVAAGQEDPFYVMDLGEVVARYNVWKGLMPRVEPFYAVKCNDDKTLLSTLAALGTGFDCASRAEIQLVKSMGVSSERIIFANPAKMASHIRYSAAVGVNTMTFDSETELLKIKQYMPHAQLLIRVRCDATSAQCPLGIKFGCDPLTEAPRLLKLAAVIGLEVIGVSFHVGSGAREAAAYTRAIQTCRALFTAAKAAGHARVTLLDIGGGFPGGKGDDISEIAQVVNAALDLHFPAGCGVRVIAEPGRYFAAAAYTLATMIHATREVAPAEGEGDSEPHTMYFINDGVYGSFNCVLYDHQHVHPHPLVPSSEKPQPCSIWGPSCDGLDCVVPSLRLPKQRTSRWLVWPDMGAYTIPVASPFNGFPVPSVYTVLDAHLWSSLSSLWPLGCARPAARPASRPPTPPPDHLGDHAVFVECALK